MKVIDKQITDLDLLPLYMEKHFKDQTVCVIIPGEDERGDPHAAFWNTLFENVPGWEPIPANAGIMSMYLPIVVTEELGNELFRIAQDDAKWSPFFYWTRNELLWNRE